MATIKLAASKSANRLINYAANKATIANGWNVMPEHAKEEFAMTRERFGKTDGRQAIHLIQSFKPGEVSPELANEIGVDLARSIAPGHEVAVYTHTDRDHIHNHLVINAVNFENGKKWQSGPKNIDRIRSESDKICLKNGLSVIEKPLAKERLTMAELQIATSGRTSWKDELRSWILEAKENTKNLDQMQDYLKQNYGVEMKIQNANLSFLHPSTQKYVRGKTLGNDYTREGLGYGHGLGQTTANSGQERTRGKTSGEERIAGLDREDRGTAGTPDQGIRENERRDQTTIPGNKSSVSTVQGQFQTDPRQPERTRGEGYTDRQEHDSRGNGQTDDYDPKRDDADHGHGEPGTEKDNENAGPDRDGDDRGAGRGIDGLGVLSSATSLVGALSGALDKLKSLGGDDKESPDQQQKVKKKKNQQNQRGLHR